MRVVVGVFVGGQARRFGGVAKGLLATADGRNIVTRLLEVSRDALPAAPIYLVGNASAYSELGLPNLEDTPPGIGPLGGLRSLLGRASDDGYQAALALACDMPAIDASLLRRLADESPNALALAPKVAGGRWSALSARYATDALPAIEALIAAGERALQRVFERLGGGASQLLLDQDELERLVDWDRPEDVPRN